MENEDIVRLKPLIEGVLADSGEGQNVSYELIPLAGAGSSRRYYRVVPDDGPEMIATCGDLARENEAFISLSNLFQRHGLSAPAVMRQSEDRLAYIQQDLGDVSLFSLLGADESEDFISEALKILPSFQTINRKEWENMVFNLPFEGNEILLDLHYFKYCFLKPSGVEFDETALEREFADIISLVDSIPENRRGLMLRDFQSRNVMVWNKSPWLIDFQGARKGPLVYDVVSFLWQAKAGFDNSLRHRMMHTYVDSLCSIRPEVGAEELMSDVAPLLLIRFLQVLGAYGFRGLVERKPHFLNSIVPGVRNLLVLFSDISRLGVECGFSFSPSERWPQLNSIVSRLSDKYLGQSANNDSSTLSQDGFSGLTVSVWSFSYKKGYPVDKSGNGGGFMFDCRALPNPGRYERYKKLCGFDQEVIDFLEPYPEVSDFLAETEKLVNRSVERYLQRGFTSLTVGYGCTGGQHRSVYNAEQLARRLHERFPQIRVRLRHREQNVDILYDAIKSNEDASTTNDDKCQRKAMILAAGLGTRLRPWTLSHPKALVPVSGKPMLARVIQRLHDFGFNKLGVNVYHFAEQVKEFLSVHSEFGTVNISDESGILLDTGGGVVKMASLLDPEGEGFLVHNVDVLSTANLDELFDTHKESGADVTLLVSSRESSRRLRFDSNWELTGWVNLQTGEEKGSSNFTQQAAFSGIWCVGPKAIAEMKEIYGSEPFAIMDYLLNRERKSRVIGYFDPTLRLLDIGKPDALAQAEEFLQTL